MEYSWGCDKKYNFPFRVTYCLRMVKELITVEMERDSLQQKWGFTVQGGKDVSLTAKIASVKVR